MVIGNFTVYNKEEHVYARLHVYECALMLLFVYRTRNNSNDAVLLHCVASKASWNLAEVHVEERLILNYV